IRLAARHSGLRRRRALQLSPQVGTGLSSQRRSPPRRSRFPLRPRPGARPLSATSTEQQAHRLIPVYVSRSLRAANAKRKPFAAALRRPPSPSSNGTEELMNRDPILFRVDGTPRLGWENLSRCLTLAAALQRRRRPTYFLSRLEPGSLGLTIKRAGNDWLDTENPVGTGDDLDETIQEVRRLHPAAVIVDAPEITEDYLQALRATG